MQYHTRCVDKSAGKSASNLAHAFSHPTTAAFLDEVTELASLLRSTSYLEIVSTAGSPALDWPPLGTISDVAPPRGAVADSAEALPAATTTTKAAVWDSINATPVGAEKAAGGTPGKLGCCIIS